MECATKRRFGPTDLVFFSVRGGQIFTLLDNWGLKEGEGGFHYEIPDVEGVRSVLQEMHLPDTDLAFSFTDAAQFCRPGFEFPCFGWTAARKILTGKVKFPTSLSETSVPIPNPYFLKQRAVLNTRYARRKNKVYC